MKRPIKWMGIGICLAWLLLCMGPAGLPDAPLFDAQAETAYITQAPPSENDVANVSVQQMTESVLAPSPAPGAGELIARAARSVLTLNVFDASGSLIATGTGVVVNDNYTLAANYHMLAGAQRVEAVSAAGYTYQLTKVAASDMQKNIALLEFQSPTDLAPLAIAAQGTAQPGIQAYFAGGPGAVSTGAECAIKAVEEVDGSQTVRFTADAALSATGGVLLNKSGQLLGLLRSRSSLDNEYMAADAAEIAAVLAKSMSTLRQPIGDVFAKLALTDYQPPQNLGAAAAETGIALTWEVSPGANRYYVYRAQEKDSAFYQLGYVYDPTYTDTSVKAGETYTYMVRAVYSAGMSLDSNRASLAIPDLYIEPTFPLAIGDSAFLDVENDVPSIDMAVKNTSRTKAVAGFTVAVFCKDEQEEYVLKEDGSDYYAYFDLSTAIGPLGGAYTGPLSLSGFLNVKYINVAITAVTLMDGTFMAIPQEDWAYSYWVAE